ncbi:MAG: hypothetical protein WDW36_010277 [Sanguina aurantia]
MLVAAAVAATAAAAAAAAVAAAAAAAVRTPWTCVPSGPTSAPCVAPRQNSQDMDAQPLQEELQRMRTPPPHVDHIHAKRHTPDPAPASNPPPPPCLSLTVPSSTRLLNDLSDHIYKPHSDGCYDFHPSCAHWAVPTGENGCELNTAFMVAHCPRSCKRCTPKPTQAGSAAAAAGSGSVGLQGGSAVLLPFDTLPWQVGVAAGVQTQAGLQGPNTSSPALVLVRFRTATQEAELAGVQDCTDTRDECPTWADGQQCTSNPGFMLRACPKSCGSCDAMRVAGAENAAEERVMWLTQPLAQARAGADAYKKLDLHLGAPVTRCQVRLNNGVLMPTIGYGCAGLGAGTAATAAMALQAGYRHFDSAQAREWYREDLLGTALAASTLPRPQLFLTSKLHPRHLGLVPTLAHFATSLAELRTDYLDLFLLHYPECWGTLCAEADVAERGATWRDSWTAMEQLHREGKVRALGVSNFNAAQMLQLLTVAVVKPAVLQVHVDPLGQSRDLQLLCRAHGIQLVAYSTLGTQYGGPVNPVLTHPVIMRIAASLGRSTAAVTLRWALQLGIVVLPRSSNAGRIRENLRVFEFELSGRDMADMAALDRNPARL